MSGLSRMPPNGKLGGMRFSVGTAFVAGALAPALTAQGIVPGWYMEARTVTNSAMHRVANELVTQTWVSGKRMRQTGIVPVSDMFPEGSFALVLDSASTTYLVSPSIRTIRMMVMPGLLQHLGLAYPGEPQHFTRVGPGEDILGHHTTIYEMTTVQRVFMPMSSDSGARELRIHQRLWLAADSADPVVRASMDPGVRAGTGRPPGIVLKSTLTTTTMGALSISQSNEVLALRLVDIDTAMFSLPSDYTVINLGDEMRATRAKSDSMMRVLDKINPSFGADQRRMLDSLLGPVDTTKRRKP